MTLSNSELRQKLIQLYEKGADSVLIDWKRDDTKPLIEEIEALIDKQVLEAKEYWRTYYGMATAEETPDYSKLSQYQLKVLADYHQKQLATLKETLKDKEK